MTISLLLLALVAAANPFRAAAATARPVAAPPVIAALAATLALAGGAALLSGPLLDAVDVSGPSARIAGGVALLVVAVKDLLARPPAPEPALDGWAAGLVPLAFPVIFSPAVAMLTIAGAAERGVGPAIVTVALALVPVGAAVAWGPATRVRLWVAAVGAAGAAVAALVVLDGVYAI